MALPVAGPLWSLEQGLLWAGVWESWPPCRVLRASREAPYGVDGPAVVVGKLQRQPGPAPPQPAAPPL